MTVMNVHGKAMTSGRWPSKELPSIQMKESARGGSAIAGDELRAVLLFLGESGIGLEAAAAAGFVRTHGANDDQLFDFYKALVVKIRLPPTDTHRPHTTLFL